MFALRFRHAVIAVTAFLTVAACGGDSPTAAPAPSVTGSFALQTYNGHPLPYVAVDSLIESVPFKIEFLSPSTMTINSDLTFRLIVTLRSSVAGGPAQVSADTTIGQYTLSGRQLMLTAEGSTVPADWDGSNMLTLRFDPDVLVFKR